MWSNEQMTPESSVSQYNLPCEQMFETSLTGEPNRIIRPALAGRCGPFPTGANRESPFGHRERSRPRGAPPPHRALPPQSWSPVDPGAGPGPGCDHRHGRRPPPRVARTPVHAQRPPPLQLSSSPGTKANNPETWNGARTLRTGRHTHIGQSSSQPESVQSRNTAGSIHQGRSAASRLDLSVNNPGVHSWVDSR